MTRAIVQARHGGPEVLDWREVAVAEPGAGEVLVRHTAIGLNYIDVYVRTGLYPLLEPPGTIGMEAAGFVEAIGPDVTDLVPGDRVAYVHNVPGSYAEMRVVPAYRLVKLPDDVPDDAAAALMLKGMTAEYLLFRTTQAAAGDVLLVHAAAGGVGLMLTKWAKHLGCTVIATVSTDAKADLVRGRGADHVIVTSREDIGTRVAEITDNAGCHYIYDGIGKDTFEASLAAIAKHGVFVSYGNASGTVPPLNLAVLTPKLIKICRPSLFPHLANRADLDAMAGNLFQAVRDAAVDVDINQRFALKDAAEAHRELEGRRTTGQSVLIP